MSAPNLMKNVKNIYLISNAQFGKRKMERFLRKDQCKNGIK